MSADPTIADPTSDRMTSNHMTSDRATTTTDLTTLTTAVDVRPSAAGREGVLRVLDGPLGVTTLTVAVDEALRLVSASDMPVEDWLATLVHWETQARGLPSDARVIVADTHQIGSGLASAVLGALPDRGAAQHVFLVHSGPDRDVIVAPGPRIVHGLPWPVAEDWGLTHLHGLGATAALEGLDWILPDGAHAAVALVNRPLVLFPAAPGRAPEGSAAVGVQAVRGPAPLRVLAAGQVLPDRRDEQSATVRTLADLLTDLLAEARRIATEAGLTGPVRMIAHTGFESAAAARRRAAGQDLGPADVWVSFADQVADGRIAVGDTVLLVCTDNAGRFGALVLHLAAPLPIRDVPTGSTHD